MFCSPLVRRHLLLVVNNGLVELTLAALDVLLNGKNFPVLGERDRAGAGGSIGAGAVAAVLMVGIAMVADVGHLLAVGDEGIRLAVSLPVIALIDRRSVSGGSADTVLDDISGRAARGNRLFLGRRTVQLGLSQIHLPGSCPGIGGGRF